MPRHTPTEPDPLGALVNNASPKPPLAWFWCHCHHAARILALGATDGRDWIDDPPQETANPPHGRPWEVIRTQPKWSLSGVQAQEHVPTEAEDAPITGNRRTKGQECASFPKRNWESPLLDHCPGWPVLLIPSPPPGRAGPIGCSGQQHLFNASVGMVLVPLPSCSKDPFPWSNGRTRLDQRPTKSSVTSPMGAFVMFSKRKQHGPFLECKPKNMSQ